MRSSKCTEHYTDAFVTFKEIMRTVSNIYHDYVPDKIKNRRNTDQLKQCDTVIIACVIWGIINDYTSQRVTYRVICSVLFPNGDFPSRSRFTRLSSNLAYTIKIIRYFFTKKFTKGELVGIIDSFPSSLCKPARNRQAKLLNQIARVGYNLTKKSYFYGSKIHTVAIRTGFPITYSVTNPGAHGAKALEILPEEANLSNILRDKGYISRKTHGKLVLKGITISVPPCKNMDKSEKLDHSLPGEQGGTAEIVFYSLEKLGCQNFNSRSVKWLESRFESTLLAYSVLLSRAQRRFEGALRHFLGY